MGLVAAVLAAVALVWAHRRRRYTRRPPSPHLRLDDPATQPMPTVVTQIRRALRRPVPEPLDDRDDVELFDDEPQSGDDRDAEVTVDDAPPPVTPALNNPMMQVWPPAGLGLTGPGAQAAARGFLAAALAAGGVDDPNGRSWVVIPAATLATLLGADAVPDTPRLTVTAGLPEALAVLDEQVLHRTRMVFDHEVDTVAALRVADPMEEPLPPMVLIADATAAHERARIAALLTQGQRLDIHGVLLGAWPDGNTVVVTADGTSTPADGEAVRHGHHPADVGRLSVIGQSEASQLLRVLGESHTGQPQPPAPVEATATRHSPVVADHGPAADNETPARPPLGATSVEAAGRVDADAQTRTGDEQAAPPVAGGSAKHSDGPDGDHGSDPTADGVGPGHDHGDPQADQTLPPDGDDSDEDAEMEQAGAGRVRVYVLGPPRIVDVAAGERRRPQAVELLVYLAARGGCASQDAILEDLLPDAPARKAPHRLNTYVYNLRRVLKATGGPNTYLRHTQKLYALNADAFELDLWRMRDAIAEADAATDPGTRIAALRRAVDAYTGPLAQGRGYEWAEPYREAIRLQALDATLTLADALPDKPDEALAVLTAAMDHHPHSEQLYQAAMRIHAERGDADAIRAVRRTLARRLDDIDTEPSDETLTLADQLIAGSRRRTPGSGRRGGAST